MGTEHLIKNAISFITELFADNSDGHDLEHSIRVYKTAMKIADNYNDCNKEIVALAALLHDADDHKLFNTEDNANARKFLAENDVPTEEINAICEVINSVSFSKNKWDTPKTIEGQIVQDADRLDATGAIGIARTFAYGGKNGRSLDDSIEHFHDKLLHLTEHLNTKEARELGAERQQLMISFLEEFKKETEWFCEVILWE